MQINFKKLTSNINYCYNKKEHVFFTWWSEVYKKQNQEREVVPTFRIWIEIKEEEDNVLILFKIAN